MPKFALPFVILLITCPPLALALLLLGLAILLIARLVDRPSRREACDWYRSV